MLRLSAANLVSLILYVAMIVMITLGLRGYRDFAMTRYATPDATASWEQWREAAAKVGKSGPVARRTPAAEEPPALLLMRDHFGACVAISLLLSSVLFLTVVVFLRGALRGTTRVSPSGSTASTK